MPRLRYASFLLAIILATLALAEYVILPTLLRLPRSTLLMGFSALPGEVIDGETINSMGFTGDVITPTKTGNTLRVLVLGGSVMFDRHLAQRLKQAIATRTERPVELVGAGLRSHTSRSSLIKLQWFVQHHDADLVLVYDSINDLWANHVPASDYSPNYRHLDPWYVRNPLLDNSLVVRYAYNTLQPVIAKLSGRPSYRFYFPPAEFMNAAGYASVQSLENNLAAIIDLSNQHGMQPVLMTFAYHLPNHYSRRAFLEQRLGYVNPDRYNERDVFNWGPPAYVRQGLELNNAAIRRTATRTGTLLIDMDHLMSPDITLFGDVCHFNDRGVDVFVNAVADRLQAAQRLSPAVANSKPH